MQGYDYTPNLGQGLYLKLEPGETVKLRIASEPYLFTNDYRGTVSTRFAWVVWNYEADKAQVLQLSGTAFSTIKALAHDEDYGDPINYDLKLTREGSGKETKYHITPGVSRAPLSTEAQTAVSEVDIQKAVKGAIPVVQVESGDDLPAPEAQDNDQNNTQDNEDDRPPVDQLEPPPGLDLDL